MCECKHTKIALENFDLDELDAFEQMQYNHAIKSMSKVDALYILINNVEGDYSQLSPALAEIAENEGKKDIIFAEGGGVGSRKEFIAWKSKNDNGERWIIGESDTYRGANSILKKFEKSENLDGYNSWGIDNTKDTFFIKSQYPNYHFDEGGSVGENGGYFTINKLREYLNDKFRDSFKFKVFETKKGSSTISASRDVDKEVMDDNFKLSFPQYKRDHLINYKISQGGENSYFEFLLEDEKNDNYIGTFGFKDRGDVDFSYITRFIAFLQEQYGLPFGVKHEVYSDGGGVNSYEQFKNGVKVKVADFYLNDESTATNDTSDTAIVFSEPSDSEELVGIQYVGGSLDYVPQDVLEVYEFKEGGEINNFRYLSIEKTDKGLKISLNEEGIELVKELKEDNKSDFEIWNELFEDITANSEYNFHNDIGDSGFGLTNIEGITDGYYYDDNGQYKTDYLESAKVYWFPNYMILSSIDEMIEKGSVIFDDADSFKNGGSVGNIKYKVRVIENDEIQEWSLNSILEEINRDRSSKWTYYNESDWKEGWNEWIEGEFYSLLDKDGNELNHAIKFEDIKTNIDLDTKVVIIKNLDNHEGYKGEVLTVIAADDDNYYHVENKSGKQWYVGEEELRVVSFKNGGSVSSKKWIKGALSGGKNKGVLRRTAMRKGLLRNNKEKLSMTDLHKLEKVGGKTANRAYMAETLRKFDGGGEVVGRGWGKYEKGNRITDIKKLKVGSVYLQHNKQFNSNNIVFIDRGDSTGLNRDIVYGGFIRPNYLIDFNKPTNLKSKKEEDFAIWGNELADNEFYEIKGMKYQEGGTIDSDRRFTEQDFNKLIDGDFGFKAIWRGHVWNISEIDRTSVLGKFNPINKKLFIFGDKDLKNHLVKWLQENSYVSSNEYQRLENGGGIENESDNEINLFEHYETLPQEVQDILNRYSDEDNDYVILERMKSELESLGYTFDYGLDASPFNLRKMKDEVENVDDVDNSFNYMMLDRLRSDNDYYLGHGNRSEKNLWAGSVDAQIKEMKRIWNNFIVKPEWLSMEDILEYERKMNNEFENGGSVYIDNVFLENSIYEKFQTEQPVIEKTISELVMDNILNGEISEYTLNNIIGSKAKYPCEYIGAIKLEKCFLRPYYRIV